jgi:hypothetical protein
MKEKKAIFTFSNDYNSTIFLLSKKNTSYVFNTKKKTRTSIKIRGDTIKIKHLIEDEIYSKCQTAKK